MAKASKKPTRRARPRRRARDAGRLILTAAALLLGGLGIGLFIGTQVRAPRPASAPVRHAAPVQQPVAPHAPASPSTPAPAPIAPPEHNPEAADEVPGPAPVPSRKGEPAARSQVATLGVPKPPPFAGTPPWIVNAVAAPPTLGHPTIALVIDDMGLDRRRSARTVALPGPLTLSFLPYADELPNQTALARQHGHELLVHVPMEPLGSANNPGPNALTTGLAGDEVIGRLRRDLARFDGFVGINNHMGSKFTSYGPGMAVVMAELRARGLLWLDSRTTGGSVGTALAREYDVPHVARDVFLDNNPSLGAVQRQLAELEALARRRGWAVAIGHPKDATLDALAAWLPTLSERGFVLVPLTHIVREAHAGAG
jgi:polysaccharide deacetylase 2 family uncharacterized protein YibQ